MRSPIFLGLVVCAWCACSPEPSDRWEVVHRKLPGALLSIWGSSPTDVWAAGSDTSDGKGPLVLRYDGASWVRVETGQQGDLWWVFGFADGPVYLGGAGGMILRYQNGALTRMSTPSADTVFGIWGAAPDDLWAVGGASGGSQGAFAWHSTGTDWTPVAGFPSSMSATDALWKVHGRAADDVWMVGTRGNLLHWDGQSLTPATSAHRESLFTVHANRQRFVAVGGAGSGIILENDGGGWSSASVAGVGPLIGVHLTEQLGYAVGYFGTVLTRTVKGWQQEDTQLDVVEGLHGVWVDPKGGVWAVGGQIAAYPLSDGILLHKGVPLDSEKR